MDNEYTTILQETLDSFYQEARSKEEYEQLLVGLS